ncbi:MAG: hypothetical protein KatS3mg129_2462 [Leptospiraceae bacterium]|nr:MAG: hypothetical protein KatS3mg129_2462 [Leptospiraceae bacterium]
MKILKYFLLIIFLIVIVHCKSQKDYNKYFNSLVVRDLNGNRFYLNQIKNPVLILNFYSPTCVPCVEELPALHLIYEEAKKLNYSMFLGVEPNLERNLPEIPEEYKNKPFDEKSFELLKQTLLLDIQKRKIKIPLIIFEPPFRIDNNEIITGTPETLIFTTNPLILRYNFIGPIATNQDPEMIQENTRYKFFISLLRTIHQNLNKSLEYNN